MFTFISDSGWRGFHYRFYLLSIQKHAHKFIYVRENKNAVGGEEWGVVYPLGTIFFVVHTDVSVHVFVSI